MNFSLVTEDERTLSKWKGSPLLLAVGKEARPCLPVRDISFVAAKEVGLISLDSYCSELDDECTSDGLLG